MTRAHDSPDAHKLFLSFDFRRCRDFVPSSISQSSRVAVSARSLMKRSAPCILDGRRRQAFASRPHAMAVFRRAAAFAHITPRCSGPCEEQVIKRPLRMPMPAHAPRERCWAPKRPPDGRSRCLLACSRRNLYMLGQAGRITIKSTVDAVSRSCSPLRSRRAASRAAR